MVKADGVLEATNATGAATLAVAELSRLRRLKKKSQPGVRYAALTRSCAGLGQWEILHTAQRQNHWQPMAQKYRSVG